MQRQRNGAVSMAFVREKPLKQSFGSVAAGIELKPGANGKHPVHYSKCLLTDSQLVRLAGLRVYENTKFIVKRRARAMRRFRFRDRLCGNWLRNYCVSGRR